LGDTQGPSSDISIGARGDWKDHAFKLGISNLLDTRGNQFAIGSPFLVSELRQITPPRPRTIRIGWETRF
jgi:hypothetical protein